MKISELIINLIELQAEVGDIEATINYACGNSYGCGHHELVKELRVSNQQFEEVKDKHLVIE